MSQYLHKLRTHHRAHSAPYSSMEHQQTWLKAFSTTLSPFLPSLSVDHRSIQFHLYQHQFHVCDRQDKPPPTLKLSHRIATELQPSPHHRASHHHTVELDLNTAFISTIPTTRQYSPMAPSQPSTMSQDVPRDHGELSTATHSGLGAVLMLCLSRKTGERDATYARLSMKESLVFTPRCSGKNVADLKPIGFMHLDDFEELRNELKGKFKNEKTPWVGEATQILRADERFPYITRQRESTTQSSSRD